MKDDRDRGLACSICGGTEDDHKMLHHQFNLHNQLIPKKTLEPKAQVQRVPTVIGGIDLELRHILLEKGIITNEDFTALRNPGGGPSGNRETGET